MMNERIKLLAEQAKTETNKEFEGPAFYTESDWYKSYNKKFAELIVKDVFAMIKESCVDADVMDRIDEVIDDRLNDAASDVVDAYGITDRIY